MKITPAMNVNYLVARGIVDSKYEKLVIKQWFGVTGSFNEVREKKIRIGLRNVPIYAWGPSLSKLMKGFGELVYIDEFSTNDTQFVEIVIQIACSAPHIPLKLKVYIEGYSYVVDVDIIGEAMASGSKVSDEGSVSLLSYDSSWDEEGEGVKDQAAGNVDK